MNETAQSGSQNGKSSRWSHQQKESLLPVLDFYQLHPSDYTRAVDSNTPFPIIIILFLCSNIVIQRFSKTKSVRLELLPPSISPAQKSDLQSNVDEIGRPAQLDICSKGREYTSTTSSRYLVKKGNEMSVICTASITSTSTITQSRAMPAISQLSSQHNHLSINIRNLHFLATDRNS